jgi:hypothetical protein
MCGKSRERLRGQVGEIVASAPSAMVKAKNPNKKNAILVIRPPEQ